MEGARREEADALSNGKPNGERGNPVAVPPSDFTGLGTTVATDADVTLCGIGELGLADADDDASPTLGKGGVEEFVVVGDDELGLGFGKTLGTGL